MNNPCIGCKNNRQALRDACTICDARVAWVKFNAKDDFDATKEKISMPAPTPETKICSACKLPKLLFDFRKHSQSPDGHVRTCNDCRRPTTGRPGKKKGSVPDIPAPPAVPRKKTPRTIHLSDLSGTLSAGLTDAHPTLTDTQVAIAAECDSIKNMLLAKNAEYGDSAVHPVRIFSTADKTEQIRVRIDDKISRLRQPGKKTIAEDTVADLIGYLILLRVAEKDARR